MEISGKRVLITGGAVRVGRAIAAHLAEKGAEVIVHYHESAEEAEELVETLRKKGRHATSIRADLSHPEAIEELVAGLPPLDVLVNNAAVFPRTPIEEVTLSTWQSVLRVNLVSPAQLAVEVGKGMAQRGHGVIVNITDCAVFRPYRNYLPYLVSKGALEMLTRVLAIEFAPHVRVNSVAPGTVLPPEDAGEELMRAIKRRSLLGQTGSPEDVARAVAFFIENDFVTGTTLTVDGGTALRP